MGRRPSPRHCSSNCTSRCATSPPWQRKSSRRSCRSHPLRSRKAASSAKASSRTSTSLRSASTQGRGLDRQAAERRDRAHGHQVAQGEIQRGLRLLHRDHRSRTWQACPRTTRASRPPPTASASSRDELKQHGGQDPRRRREAPVRLEYEEFVKLRTRAMEHLAEIQETAEAIADTGRARHRSRRRRGSSTTCRPLSERIAQPVDPRWPASGARPEPRRRALRAE